MKQKENKGGILSNEKLEQDLEVRRRNGATDTRGMQDTGDQKVRHMGNDVQKNDGLGKDENSGETAKTKACCLLWGILRTVRTFWLLQNPSKHRK